MLRLAFPAIGHAALLSIMFVVERRVVGQASSSALASLQISTALVWALTTLASGFGAATLAVVGRAVGARDERTASTATRSSVALAGLLGLAGSLGLLAFSEGGLSLVFAELGVAVASEVQAYLRVAAVWLPLAFVESALASALHARGDTRSPLWAALVGNAVNLTAACVLVFGWWVPAQGARGAAIAGGLAIATQLLWLLRRSPHALGGAQVWSWDGAMVRRLLVVGLPACADRLVYAGGYLAVVVVIGRLGATAMAANQVVSAVEALCFMCAEGFGVAAASLVARELGRGREELAARALRAASVLAIVPTAACGALFIASPQHLLSAFGASPEVTDVGVGCLIVAGISQPFMAYAMVVRAAMRGAGAPQLSLWVALVGTAAVRLPLTYVLAHGAGLGLLGVWLASTADWVVQAGLCSLALRSGAIARASSPIAA